ncbi:MAG: transcription termination factor Rho, partial [Akkermansiaceae bacterium]
KQTDAAPAKPEPTPAKTEPAPAKSEPVAEATPTPSASPPAPEDQPKIGRVKGLGRVKKPKNRDSAPQADAAPQQGNDESATPNKGRKQHQQGKQGQQGQNHQHGQQGQGKKKRTKNNRNNRNNRNNQGGREKRERKPIVFSSEPVEVNGMLELAPKGFGFLRVPEKNFIQCKKDVFVTPDFVRKYGLRAGVWIHGTSQEGPRGPQLTALSSINEIEPDEAFKLPHFEELKAVNPSRRIAFESTPDRFTTRVLDIVSPVGRGQRGLIVSPPRSGKTTLLLHMAEAIREKYDESIHLIVLLVDERPEEVTEFKRCLPGAEIYASSNDDGAKNHTRLSEMCIERAKRLVEGGKDVLILMDSITRLARAYNRGGGGGGGGGNKRGKNRGYQSGGIVAGALEMPRRLFAAARDTRNAGSLTILATALIQTNSRADEAIFQEFKGTGNMELVLDRRIAEQYIYPAVDIFKSGTRREELIMAEHLLHKIHLIRRGLSGHRPDEAMERLLFFLKKFPNNAQMLMEIKG